MRCSRTGRPTVPNGKLGSYRFQKSFYNAGMRLSQRTRALFYAGILDYYFTGAEPDLPQAAANLFEGFRERVAMARSKALRACEDGLAEESARDSGGIAGEHPASSAGVAGEYQTSSQRVPAAEHLALSGKTAPEVLRSSLGVLRKEKGVLREEESSLGAVFLKDARSLPEFLAEVREECERQEAFELLEGDAIERWATDWVGQGWRDRNGCSLDELLPDGEGGYVERWRLMFRGLCDKAKKDSERSGGSWG